MWDKNLNNVNRIPCSVSQELVNMVANEYPLDFKTANEEINIGKLLFYIGFKMDTEVKGLGFYRNYDVLVRDNKNPSKLYKTACVYNGEVRNLVEEVDPRTGRITYSNSKHPLCWLYENIEVLQPKHLETIIAKEDFFDILDIGDPILYDKAWLIRDKPANKTNRNVVRSSVDNREKL